MSCGKRNDQATLIQQQKHTPNNDKLVALRCKIGNAGLVEKKGNGMEIFKPL
jgi:hypothetical protein